MAFNLEYDKNLEIKIIEQYAKDIDGLYCKDIMERIIFNYCDEKYVNDSYNLWTQCEGVNTQRQPILREALDMHLVGNYYSSTALLMCQLYGIIVDISHYAQNNNISISAEYKNLIAKHYKIEEHKINSEKGKFIQLSAIPESGALLWEAVTEYLQNEILCSSESKKRWMHQPLRNKICHGEQLNFGTKEHSLKAILCIDILMNLSNEIYKLSKITRNSIEGLDVGSNAQI
ncbi:MAG: hypothetical protein VR67_03315 [Peptococcaceae bacterium BRH_c8a]|nr:MAG: hypothetical protein VR67_03315 [Peptococcaceae bacterium BRH_c8a]